ncbi:MAG: GAF domain-containing protein, partial [Anaerolineae bacterium]
MATSVQNTSELNTVAQKEFAAWLAEIEPALAREAGDAASAPEVAAWLRLLKEASAGADVAPLLADLTLSPSQVARLFEQASALIPAQNYALLRHLFLLQGRLMAAAPAGEAESKLAALAGLAAQLAQIKQPARLMTQAVAIIARAFGYPSLNLILLLGEGKTLKVQDSLWRNVPPSPKEVKAFAAQISAPQNPIMQAAQTGQSQLSLQPAYTAPPPLTNTAAEIAVPIVLRNRTIGVIHRFSNTPDRLDRSELRMLEAIAGQLAQAIENVQLSATYRKRAQEQRILLESTAALGSSLQTDKIMRLLAVKIAEALNAGACVISQWRADTQTLTVLARHIRAHKDNPATTWRKENKPIPIQRDAVGRQALQTMRPVAVRAGQPDSKPQPWSRPGWQSLLAFPLQTQGEKLGLIEVYDRNRERVFTVDDINLGQALAGQATVVMGQIQMMRDTQYRLAEVSTFYTLSQQLITASPLKLEQLLDNIVNTMRLVADCRACVLFLLDPQEEYLEIKAASGLKKRWKKAARLAVGEGAAGQAVAQKRVIYIPDTTKDPSYVFFDQAVRSIIVVPMLFRGRAIGAINLDDSRPNAFGKSQERLLSIAANQAAIAIQNATLFEQVVSEEQRMRAIIQHMADGLLLLSQTGKIVKINPALTTMLNMHASEIVGQNIYTDHLEPRLAAICTPLTEKKRT